MAIKGGQLKEREDYQAYILKMLQEENGYQVHLLSRMVAAGIPPIITVCWEVTGSTMGTVPNEQENGCRRVRQHLHSVGKQKISF